MPILTLSVFWVPVQSTVQVDLMRLSCDLAVFSISVYDTVYLSICIHCPSSQFILSDPKWNARIQTGIENVFPYTQSYTAHASVYKFAYWIYVHIQNCTRHVCPYTELYMECISVWRAVYKYICVYAIEYRVYVCMQCFTLSAFLYMQLHTEYISAYGINAFLYMEEYKQFISVYWFVWGI